MFFGKKTPKALIADDDVVQRVLIDELVSTMGFDVLAAANGREALETARRERPDFIILDIDMPLLDGVEVLAKLREHPGTKDIPVMMCSGQGAFDKVEGCLALGAKDYVIKPYDVNAFRTKLKAFLAKHLPG